MKLTLLLLLTLCNSVCARDAINVTVGMYPFAPFVETKGKGGEEGMTIDLITALNKLQKKYYFKAIRIPPKRRYQSYKDGHYDVIFYENKAWGWQDIEINASRVYQTGGEVYVTLNKKGRGQEYFDDFSGKRMMGILGFHYGFADFNSDEIFLKKQFHMQLSHDNDKNLAMLLKGRGDVVVVTKAYLQRYLLQNPQAEEQLLISDKLDQEYNHTVLVRPNMKPTVEEINRMLEALDNTGALTKLLIKYGIDP
jgi:ABC-type amino acid transport substrate-binding protein